MNYYRILKINGKESNHETKSTNYRNYRSGWVIPG